MTISIKEARKILGKNSSKYTDEQITEVIDNLTALADIIIAGYILEKVKRKSIDEYYAKKN